MARYELIVRNGRVVTELGVENSDVAVSGGIIAAVGPELEGGAASEVDVAGRLVLPAVIDAHVHFNEPGRTDWEGWATGSRALAAGGGTVCLEMPLNAHPPTLDGAAFDAKRAAAEAASVVDFGLWGGITPVNIHALDELASCGVIGYKAFMSASGTDDFPLTDDDTLYRGMAHAARYGLPVAVHAENDAITHGMARRARAAGKTAMRDYLDSRPAIAELEAITRAITLAEAAGCALHIVHVSTGRGVALVAEARERGVDVTCETCPHYLWFTGEDAERIGALAKCAPPLRDEAERAMLWTQLIAGDIDFVASDHSPAPPAMKESDDVFANWGGIAGCQHLLSAVVIGGAGHGLPLPDIARLTAGAVARRFRLAGKGGLAVGNDADLVIGEMTGGDHEPVHCYYRHPANIWDDVLRGFRVVSTLRRGQWLYRDGKPAPPTPGQLLTPAG
jgi:allantoinase